MMDEIFGSLEWHIYDHLQSADSMLAKVSSEATCFGIPAAFQQEYIQKKLIDMIEQIAEQRGAKRASA